MKYLIILVIVVVGFVYCCNQFGISSVAVVAAGVKHLQSPIK